MVEQQLLYPVGEVLLAPHHRCEVPVGELGEVVGDLQRFVLVQLALGLEGLVACRGVAGPVISVRLAKQPTRSWCCWKVKALCPVYCCGRMCSSWKGCSERLRR